MKKSNIIILLALLLMGTAAHAQFNKPLQSSSNRVNPNEAKYNIGLIGGVTMTQWVHFGGTKTPYNYKFNFGPTAGLTVERMLNKSTSVSLEGLFAMRNTQLNYDVVNFPVALNQNKDYYRQYDVDYQEVNVQVPITFYLSNGNIRPYVFVGPRFSLPLSGKMIWQKKEILNYGTPEQQYSETGATIDTVEMNAQNLRSWNVGLVAGAGVLFKINMNNYYLLLKLDASAHATAINSFTKEEINGEATNVIGAAYIDPYLLGMRFNTDATVKLTIMFPLKKQLKGACMKWGDYD
ncbi:MAG: PorT family protein [Bacteroidales bacterium]|nr:PorT family protein [Bacteroidales bacterium]